MRLVILLTMISALVSCGAVEKHIRPEPVEVKVEGEEGPQGEAGSDGSSCSVSPLPEGALIECEDGSSAIINHGQDGDDGMDGADGEDGDVLEVPQELVYEGYFCGRTVVSLGKIYYILHNQMVPLTSKWFKVSNSCEVRVKSNKIETK